MNPVIDNNNNTLTIITNKYIQTVEEVAQYFQKSPSWVYKNWKLLGGKKLGGSLIFPAKEDLYERILFPKKTGVEVRLHQTGNQVYGNLVENKERGQRGRRSEKGGNCESKTYSDDQNRHGLLGIDK